MRFWVETCHASKGKIYKGSSPSFIGSADLSEGAPGLQPTLPPDCSLLAFLQPGPHMWHWELPDSQSSHLGECRAAVRSFTYFQLGGESSFTL